MASLTSAASVLLLYPLSKLLPILHEHIHLHFITALSWKRDSGTRQASGRLLRAECGGGRRGEARKGRERRVLHERKGLGEERGEGETREKGEREVLR